MCILTPGCESRWLWQTCDTRLGPRRCFMAVMFSWCQLRYKRKVKSVTFKKYVDTILYENVSKMEWAMLTFSMSETALERGFFPLLKNACFVEIYKPIE